MTAAPSACSRSPDSGRRDSVLNVASRGIDRFSHRYRRRRVRQSDRRGRLRQRHHEHDPAVDVVEFVDLDGDGIGDSNADVVRTFETGFDVSQEQVNDYLDIEGGVVAIGAPGAGGQVGLFQFDGFTWSNSPVDVVQPAGRQAGDRIGRAIALDGRTLVTGVPGDDGAVDLSTDAGAVYWVEVPVVATALPDLIEASAPEDFWDVRVVPGPNDHAIVLSALYADPLPISGPSTFGRLTAFGNVDVGDRLEVLGATRIDGGLLAVQGDGEFRPLGNIDFANNGELSVAAPEIDFTGPGLLTVDGAVSVTGTGQISNLGDVVKTGAARFSGARPPGTPNRRARSTSKRGRCCSPADRSRPLTTSTGSRAHSALQRGRRSTFGAVWSSWGRRGSSPRSPDHPVMSPTTGSVRIDVNLTKDGLLSSDLVGYSPGPAEAYPVITCLDCYPGRFAELGTAPFDVMTTPSQITLQLAENKILGPGADLGFGIERFGFDVDIDGDWAVVGAPDPSGETLVYEFVGGDWVFRQALGNPASSVAIQGNVIAAGGYLYTRLNTETPFVINTVIGGDVFDIDGDMLIIGQLGTFQSVRVRSLSAASEVELSLPPSPINASFGAEVAIVDLGNGDAYAAVGAPEEFGGRVYAYKRSAGTWNDTADEILASPDGGVGQFGNSIEIDGATMVIGERLNSAGELPRRRGLGVRGCARQLLVTGQAAGIGCRHRQRLRFRCCGRR